MNLTYYSSIVRYERVGDRVTPLRVRRQWILAGDQPAWRVVRVTKLEWREVFVAPAGDGARAGHAAAGEGQSPHDDNGATADCQRAPDRPRSKP
jgi:hypothetical protein